MILVGWNDGERARDALALAAVFARGLGTGIRLAHVYETYPAYPPYTDLTEASREAGQQTLDEAPLADLDGIGVEKALLTAHSPSAGLHALAGGADVEMIVIGSTHLGKLGRVLLGTVGTHLLHGCPSAVAVAPAGYAQRRPTPFARVLVAFDASPESRAAVEEGTRIAQGVGAKLRIVSVIGPTPYARVGASTLPPSEISSIALAARGGELHDVVASRPPEVECEEILRDGSPPAVLCEEAEDGDLLVTGSRGYGPLRSVLLGSVSSAVVRCAPCPVLVIPRSVVLRPREGLRPDAG